MAVPIKWITYMGRNGPKWARRKNNTLCTAPSKLGRVAIKMLNPSLSSELPRN